MIFVLFYKNIENSKIFSIDKAVVRLMQFWYINNIINNSS